MKKLELIDNEKKYYFYMIMGLIFNILTFSIFFNETYIFFHQRPIYLNRKKIYDYIKENDLVIKRSVLFGCIYSINDDYLIYYDKYRNIWYVTKNDYDNDIILCSFHKGNCKDTIRYKYIKKILKENCNKQNNILKGDKIENI